MKAAIVAQATGTDRRRGAWRRGSVDDQASQTTTASGSADGDDQWSLLLILMLVVVWLALIVLTYLDAGAASPIRSWSPARRSPPSSLHRHRLYAILRPPESSRTPTSGARDPRRELRVPS